LRASFYTAYHKTAPLLASRSVRPIHVGRATAAAPLSGMIGDDTGDHISGRNAAYCELTALYWAWKNDHDSTHLGLMHYRRVFDLGGRFDGTMAERKPGVVHIPDLLTDIESWVDQIGPNTVLLPETHVMGRNVEENYARGHAIQDFEAVRRIIAAHHPDDLGVFDKVARGRKVRLGNMALFPRPLFDRYCSWLFDILDRLEAEPLDRSRYSTYQARYPGFIAERLLTVFAEKLAEDPGAYDIHEAPIVNFADALVTPVIADDSLNGARNVNIAFSADRAYLPHAAAMLRSMFDHAAPDRTYTLFFLHSRIGVDTLAPLRAMLAGLSGVTLTEINVGAVFDTSYRSASRAPSNATYNRFLLFELLPGIDRILYVDADMIFRGDVARIFDADLGGQPIGAVPDYIMTRTLTGPTPTVDPQVPDLYRYQRDVLGLSDDDIAGYVNAGLVLFDFAAMDVPRTGRDLVEMARTKTFLFRDQDILNAYFKGRIARLDDRWNVFNTDAAGYGRVPADNHAKAMAARRDPLVIHYASGDFKPWLPIPVLWAEHYWGALCRTPYFAEVIAGTKTAHHVPKPRVAGADHGRLVRFGARVANRFPVLRPVLLRLYARLRSRQGR